MKTSSLPQLRSPLLTPGSVGGCPPTPPQTRTCGFPAYGSLSHGFAPYTECTTLLLRYPLLYREHVADLCVSFMFPNNSSVTRPPPSLLPARTGLLRRVSIDTMRRLRLP